MLRSDPRLREAELARRMAIETAFAKLRAADAARDNPVLCPTYDEYRALSLAAERARDNANAVEREANEAFHRIHLEMERLERLG
jgi:hypothetical protein